MRMYDTHKASEMDVIHDVLAAFLEPYEGSVATMDSAGQHGMGFDGEGGYVWVCHSSDYDGAYQVGVYASVHRFVAGDEAITPTITKFSAAEVIALVLGILTGVGDVIPKPEAI